MVTKKSIVYILTSLILFSLGWWGSDIYKNYLNKEQMLPAWNKPKPLEKYTIENLSKTNFEPSKITIDKNIFSFKANGKKVTGLINMPEGNGPFPVVVLLRGYVDQSIYTTGTGTKRVGEYFSKNGYILSLILGLKEGIILSLLWIHNENIQKSNFCYRTFYLMFYFSIILLSFYYLFFIRYKLIECFYALI